jgi:uncharacterized membrane protein
MTTETATRPLGSIPTTRIEAFSDGVFAIATTLLVLEIAVPSAEHENLFEGLGDLWPSYLGYLVGFFTIGVMWINHHFLIGLFDRVTRPLLFLNLALLGVVAFIPFPTAVVAEYLAEGSAAQLSAAAVLYGIVMLLLSVAFTLIWVLAKRSPEAIRVHEATARVIPRGLRFSVISIILYAISIAVAFVAPVIALSLFVVVVLLFSFVRIGK